MKNILHFIPNSAEVFVSLLMEKVNSSFLVLKPKEVALGPAFLSSALLNSNHLDKLSCATTRRH